MPRRSPSRAGPLAPLLRPAAAAVMLAATVIAVTPAAGGRPLPPYAAGFPQIFPRPVDTRPREGALVRADLDHDGRPELVVSVPAGLLTVVEADGRARAGWPRRFTTLPQPAWPAGLPGIGDLDGDGRDDIVTCVTAGPPPRRTFMMALGDDGAGLPGWPIELLTSGAGAGCSPGATVVADLDGDGRGEVVRADGASVHVLDRFGEPLPGWPWDAPPDPRGRLRPINADPLAADLDGDGRPEVVVVESGYEPRLFALDASGLMMPGFPMALAQVVDRQAPAAGDLDGDGHPEIVQATLPFVGDMAAGPEPAPATARLGRPAPAIPGARTPIPAVQEPAPLVPAFLHALRCDGTPPPGWPIVLGGGALHGAITTDLDGDGAPEILQGVGDRVDGYDGAGRVLRGFPLVVRGLPRAAEVRIDTQWSAADLDGNGSVDLLRASGFVVSGAVALRMIGLQVPGGSARGYPFTVEGLLPASAAVAADLNGDGRPEAAVLAGEGTNGGWRLLAWDVAAGRGP